MFAGLILMCSRLPWKALQLTEELLVCERETNMKSELARVLKSKITEYMFSKQVFCVVFIGNVCRLTLTLFLSLSPP